MSNAPAAGFSVTKTPISDAGGSNAVETSSVFDFGDKNGGGDSEDGSEVENVLNGLFEKVLIGIVVGLAVKFVWSEIK